MTRKKMLVTGAPGWLGTRLIEVLCEQGEQVRCLILEDADVSILQKMGVELVVGDVRDATSLKKAVEGVESVFHCAGIIHPKIHVNDFYEINTTGTQNMLDASVEGGVKKFIYVSSNSAQGFNVNKETLMVEDGPCRPTSEYGKSKYLAEEKVRGFQDSGKIQTVILRPCWYYGPRQPARMTKLMNMIKSGRPLLFGNGLNLRSMTYIDNLVDALLLVESNDKANGQTYWIGDEKPHTTLEIYQEIAEVLGAELRPRRVPKIISQILEVVDIILGKLGVYEINLHVAGEMVKNIACSTEKAKRELGYKPRISFKEGILKSVEWTQENKLV
ncbi:MAG: NAD(P)-dependent oxidoreductase [Methanobacteriota archaeon]